MADYLSHYCNRAQVGERVPDENFAREIKQLFTIGLWELNPDGTQKLNEFGDPIQTYDNDDISAVARAFTGLGWSPEPSPLAADRPSGVAFDVLGLQGGWRNRLEFEGPDWTMNPMIVHPEYHDWNEKRIPNGVDEMGQRIHAVIPSRPQGQRTHFRALADMERTVEILVNHPNTAPFISKQLIQFLVTSNPSPEYVERVAYVFNPRLGGGSPDAVVGDLESVIRAILTDPEARDPLQHLAKDYFGKVREPLLRYTHLARVLKFDRYEYLLHMDTDGTFNRDMRQVALFPPSVFNFYRPDYTHPGEINDRDLVSPAFQILNSYTSTSVFNRLWSLIDEGYSRRWNRIRPNYAGEEIQNEWGPRAVYSRRDFNPDISHLYAVAQAGNEVELLDRASLIFTAGTLGKESREEILTILQEEPNRLARANLAAFLTLVSPEGAVLK